MLGCGLRNLRDVERPREEAKGASADFRNLGRKHLWAEKERRKEIPFYFQKAFSWTTK
jgi:hypothetical protein